MDGYDAAMYMYFWSEVISEDMYYTRFRKDGIYNRKTGRDFRNEILRPGGSRSAAVSLERFLGRKSNSAAFFARNSNK
ncbi:Thimet oligopeptidase [Coemansia sp. RSA 2611]|nr:Thimet oligopeptidase [Coemansia sp. RSA 2705]KAJ2392132.1 Thimet oligopeptidase [Coemansia sp. RSA 2611]